MNHDTDTLTTTCDHITSCDTPDEHTSLDCYARYVELGNEPGVEMMTLAEWSIEMAKHVTGPDLTLTVRDRDGEVLIIYATPNVPGAQEQLISCAEQDGHVGGGRTWEFGSEWNVA